MFGETLGYKGKGCIDVNQKFKAKSTLQHVKMRRHALADFAA